MYYKCIMQIKFKIKILLIAASFLMSNVMLGQETGKIIDQVIAVVGGNIILESEVEAQYMQYKMQEGITTGSAKIKCSLLETMLYQKLLLNPKDHPQRPSARCWFPPSPNNP